MICLNFELICKEGVTKNNFLALEARSNDDGIDKLEGDLIDWQLFVKFVPL